MQYTTAQVRAYDVINIISLICAYAQTMFRWPKDSILLAKVEKVDGCTILDCIKATFASEKTYKLGQVDMSGEQIIHNVTDYLSSHAEGPYTQIMAGNHRLVAAVVSDSCLGTDIVSLMLVSEEEDNTQAYWSNIRHNCVTKLDRLNAVQSIVHLLDSGDIQGESDCWDENDKTKGTRYQAIIHFGMAKLVKFYGAEIDKVIQLNDKELAEVKKAINPLEMIDFILSSPKTAPVKAVNKKQWKECLELAEARNPALVPLLLALSTGQCITALDLIGRLRVEMLEAVEAVTVEAVAVAKTKAKK